MLKLCFTLILGAFLIYGLDDLGIITSDDFKVIERPQSASFEEVKVEPSTHLSSRFTDRIVQKHRDQKEGV